MIIILPFVVVAKKNVPENMFNSNSIELSLGVFLLLQIITTAIRLLNLDTASDEIEFSFSHPPKRALDLGLQSG